MSELVVNFSDMSEKELIEFKTKLEKQYEKMCDERADELAELNILDFDPYSYGGGKQIKKIVDKYKDFDDGYSYLMEELLKEMHQRQISLLDIEIKDEKIEAESMSDEEFIFRELQKNKQFKDKK